MYMSPWEHGVEIRDSKDYLPRENHEHWLVFNYEDVELEEGELKAETFVEIIIRSDKGGFRSSTNAPCPRNWMYVIV